MKAPAKFRWLLMFGTLALIGISAWMVARPTPIDWTKEQEPFRSMAMPLKKVTASPLGHVTLTITDKNQRSVHVRFYHEYDTEPNSAGCYSYDPLLIGIGPELKDPARAKILAIRLLKEYSHDKVSDLALEELQKGRRSRLSLVFERMKRWLWP